MRPSRFRWGGMWRSRCWSCGQWRSINWDRSTRHARLSLAETMIPVELRTLGTDSDDGPLPVHEYVVAHDWLISEILLREAHALIAESTDKVE